MFHKDEMNKEMIILFTTPPTDLIIQSIYGGVIIKGYDGGFV